MKRFLTFLLAALLCFAFAACNTNTNTGESSTEPDAISSATKNESQSSTDSTDNNANTSNYDNAEQNETKILIAYFSCTGTTEQVAKHIENNLQADLYEITPEIPYTSADLNYSDSSTRATKEQRDESARPAISGTVESMSDYDIVFLGYPIWWGQAPKVIYTFLESYDFSGKTIIPFCTSHSSGIGSSDTELHSLCSDSTKWVQGKRFGGNASESEVVQWVNGLEKDRK